MNTSGSFHVKKTLEPMSKSSVWHSKRSGLIKFQPSRMICLYRALFQHRHASFAFLIKFHADIAKRQGISFPMFLLTRSANFWRKSTFSITPCQRAFLHSCTLSEMGPWRYGSVQRMRPGGDDRMRCTRSNGRVVEIGGGLTATSTHAAWREGATACVVRAREGGS